MLYGVLIGLYILVCALLLVVVLLQQGKGGDIAAAFGGAGSQTAFGARSGATFLTRATAVLGALFILGSLGLGVMSNHGAGNGSVMSGVAAPAAPKTAAPALPSQQALPQVPATTPPAAGSGGSTPPPAGSAGSAKPAPASAGSTTPAPAPTKKGGGL
jgi:preprotein translocase subunit SecG